MHFVNHVDLVARIGGRVHRLLQKGRHFFNGAVACRVHFNVVNKTSLVDRAARFTDATRVIGHAAFAVGAHAVEAFCQNSRKRCFPNPTRSRKEVGVMESVFTQRMSERLNHRFLPHYTFKIMRPPFTGQYLRSHYLPTNLWQSAPTPHPLNDTSANRATPSPPLSHKNRWPVDSIPAPPIQNGRIFP